MGIGMKISAIKSNYTSMNRTQSFNGLWGRTSNNIDIDAVLGIPSHYVTFYYYPFSDESVEDIQKVVKENSSAYMKDINGQSKYIVRSCNVCTTLPFSKIEYEEYSSAGERTGTSKSLQIHKYLSALCGRFIDNKTEEQTSAINPNFNKSLSVEI